ncbi:GIY-YIG nuclease family protein [Priestia megaterium]|uniref:GIY-YIG nuclease family protein n=1 Tax=Priestia megaterium TaxID=1404 RepID=UPI00077D9011|nr:GIY-YIG nuclease family protein [Priestia megaterium]
MYYVYIHKHKLTKEVLYCGKGSNKRYKDYNSRGEEHLKLMKDKQLDYIILKYFNNEEEAYAYEEKLTEEYKKQGQCLFNINIGRKVTEETKLKLSKALKGKKRTEETKEFMKQNHARPLAQKVFMYKDGVLIKSFGSSREAGVYAAGNGICSYGWCGRSLKTGEITMPTKKFPLGGYLFQYEDAKMELEQAQ